jgi:hypothetical protein
VTDAGNAPGRITGRAELSLADQYAAIFWAGPRVFRVGVVALVVGTAVVVAIEFLSPQPNFSIVSMLMLFAFICVGMVAVGHSRLKPAQKRIEYLIDRERIVIKDDSGTAFATPWDTVTAIEEHGPGLVLRQKSGGRWLVKRAFTPQDLAALKAMKS